jgi:predicted DNA binding CopG/RHH family protein
MATRLGKPYQTLIHELLEKAPGTSSDISPPEGKD